MSPKLPANALFFTIIIALIIGLLCSSLIFIAYYHRMQIQQHQTKERLIHNAESAIYLLFAKKDVKGPEILDLFGNQNDSVMLQKNVWGLFEIGHVKAFSHRDTVSRTIMMGAKPDSVWNACLYLVDQGWPLSLAGNALLKGLAYLPEAGLKRGNVEGKNFERTKLIEGETKKSTSTLPPINSTFLSSIQEQVDPQHYSQYLSEKALRSDSLVAAFDQPTQCLFVRGRPLYLNRIKIKGNILLSSDTLIEVSSDCKLENVLLSAPKIIFKDGFKGKVQAFATDSLLTGEDCHFQYPSTLALFETDSVDNQPKLMIGKDSKVEGVAFLYVSFLDRSNALLSIHESATVTGQVWADGRVSHRGKLAGTLACRNFRLSLSSGTFDNHLLDCEIDRSKLSKYFIGSPLFTSSKKDIVQWLE